MNQSGIIVLDKPAGKSSAFITRLIGRKVGAKKVGHLGTLDPFATGILPIAVNEATKLIPYIKSERKTYVFEVVFGEKRDTGDVTGKITETSSFLPSKGEILSVLSYFRGQLPQVPHRFSAVKVNGKKAYKVARTGENPSLKERQITIFSLELMTQTSENSFAFQASVSSGTYIRTLAEDIASKLGSVAYVRDLRRIQDGQFDISRAVTVAFLENSSFCLDNILRTPESVLRNSMPIVEISLFEAKTLGNGKPTPISWNKNEIVALSLSNRGLFAIANVIGGVAFVQRGLHLENYTYSS